MATTMQTVLPAQQAALLPALFRACTEPMGGYKAMSAPQPPKCALLWCPIPIITWIIPFIGHMGISTSTGTAVDFAGPFMVHEDSDGGMIFGKPTRYLLLDPRKAQVLTQYKAPPEDGTDASSEAASAGCPGPKPMPMDTLDNAGLGRWWDSQVNNTVCSFQNQMYNIFGNNCHALASSFLNQMKYDRSSNWNMIHLAALMFLQGRYTSVLGFLVTWVPFIVIAGVGGYFGQLIFLYAWLGLTVPLVLWFVLYVYVFSKQNEKP